jgi:hypothetical protein
MDYMKDALRTYRRKQGSINVHAGATGRIAAILGKHYAQSSSSMTYSSAEFKRTLTNLVAKLKIAVKRNVFTDGVHHKHIDQLLKQIQEGIEGYPEAEPQALLYLIFLAFELMGDLPNNKTRLSTRENNFSLNGFRTVRYLQTPHQRAALIYATARWRSFSEYSSDKAGQEIEDRYFAHYRDPDDFLKWFKGKYPSVYAEMF